MIRRPRSQLASFAPANLLLALLLVLLATLAAPQARAQGAPASASASPGAARAADASSAAAAPPLKKFTPITDMSWWAVLGGDRDRVVRTTDGGRSWTDATPQTLGGAAIGWFFADADVAWAWTQLPQGATAPGLIYRTTDGGRGWQAMGSLPEDGCEMSFADRDHIWCAVIAGQAGSEALELYRSVDAGASWALVSRTTPVEDPKRPNTPNNLPFPCDKAIRFTSAAAGWAGSFCSIAPAYLYSTSDGGVTWLPQAIPPLPGPFDGCDADFGPPAMKDGTVAFLMVIGCEVPRWGMSFSSDGGKTWNTGAIPGPPPRLEGTSAAIADATHWRATDGATFAATDDGGQNWQTWPLDAPMHGRDFELTFLTPLEGWIAASDPGAEPQLWRTLDAGRTWTPVTIAAPLQ